ncbi:MAG: hypothetical protein IKW88_01355 [Clostridiales bacterium]|nr:hypothetical protein [Clostridiales bacterium]
MQLDFHYYATYCAAYLSGYSHKEALDLAYSAQFVDCCTKTFLKSVSATIHAATTQTQAELLDTRTDLIGLQDITRIWSSFHFLPRDLYAETPRATKTYKNKYRLICGPNGTLVKDTMELAKDKSIQHAGIAMHVLADTWAHQRFAGTPSLVINNTDKDFVEILPDGSMRPIKFKHAPGAEDDLENGLFNSTVFNTSETSILNLGHGHAGHLPDYSFIRYRYIPAWDNYRECIKDNPSDYRNAFCQMIYAMKYLRGAIGHFETDTYEEEAIKPYEERIIDIITKRQLDASMDWKDFAKELSGEDILDFDTNAYIEDYKAKKDDSFLGRFILAALSQKSMVTNKIYTSKNMLAGFSVDYNKKGFAGIKDYIRLVSESVGISE